MSVFEKIQMHLSRLTVIPMVFICARVVSLQRMVSWSFERMSTSSRSRQIGSEEAVQAAAWNGKVRFINESRESATEKE